MCKHRLITERMRKSHEQVLVIKRIKSLELGKTNLKNNKEKINMHQSQKIPATE